MIPLRNLGECGDLMMMCVCVCVETNTGRVLVALCVYVCMSGGGIMERELCIAFTDTHIYQ